MKKLFIIFILGLLLSSCEPHRYKFINTEVGFVPYASYYCDLGFLQNNDRQTVFKLDGKPIRCSPLLIKMTKDEFKDTQK